MTTDTQHLRAAVRLLIDIKQSAMHARMNGPRDGLVTGEGRALFDVEGMAEEYLNRLALADPGIAAPWKMTPEFAEDNNITTLCPDSAIVCPKPEECRAARVCAKIGCEVIGYTTPEGKKVRT